MALSEPGARPTVLIGFAEALSAPEAAWSLLEAGFDVVAFTRRGSRPSLRKCKDIRIVEVPLPEEDAHRAVAELVSLASSVGARVGMPLDDAAVWLWDQVASSTALSIAGPTGSQARFALDKSLQLEAARRAGFAVPPTRHFDSASEALEVAEFPVVLKPALALLEHKGRLRRGPGHVCANERELEAALAPWPEGVPILVQPLLTGVGEGIFGFADAETVWGLSAHRRIRMMNPQGSGSSACSSAPVDDELTGLAQQMLSEAGWRGMFMIELLRETGGKVWFIELNGRSWGSMALARRMGLEYPAWAAQSVVDPEFEAREMPTNRPVVCRHLGREIVHLLFVLRGPKSTALSQWPSRWQTLKNLLRVSRNDRWYNWRRGDAALFFDDAVRTVLHQLRGRA